MEFEIRNIRLSDGIMPMTFDVRFDVLTLNDLSLATLYGSPGAVFLRKPRLRHGERISAEITRDAHAAIRDRAIAIYHDQTGMRLHAVHPSGAPV